MEDQLKTSTMIGIKVAEKLYCNLIKLNKMFKLINNKKILLTIQSFEDMEHQLKTTLRTGDHLRNRLLIKMFSKFKTLQIAMEFLKWMTPKSKMILISINMNN
jgi:hypothetical protein